MDPALLGSPRPSPLFELAGVLPVSGFLEDPAVGEWFVLKISSLQRGGAALSTRSQAPSGRTLRDSGRLSFLCLIQRSPLLPDLIELLPRAPLRQRALPRQSPKGAGQLRAHSSEWAQAWRLDRLEPPHEIPGGWQPWRSPRTLGAWIIPEDRSVTSKDERPLGAPALQGSDRTGKGLRVVMAATTSANSTAARAPVGDPPTLSLPEWTSRLAQLGQVSGLSLHFWGCQGGDPQGIDLHVAGPTKLFL